jgi:uncharacterized tellurite resistance protein B-like protein
VLKFILERLGLGLDATDTVDELDTPAIQMVASGLDGLVPDQARYLAVFAMVLARAARADLEVSDNERWVMSQILGEYTDLPDDQIELLLEMVVHRNRLFGATDDYVATREFRAMLSDQHRECMLRCLFAVCAADDSISLVEEEEVRQIATELGLSHEQYTAARAEYRDKREVLRGLDTLSRNDD